MNAPKAPGSLLEAPRELVEAIKLISFTLKRKSLLFGYHDLATKKFKKKFSSTRDKRHGAFRDENYACTFQARNNVKP